MKLKLLQKHFILQLLWTSKKSELDNKFQKYKGRVVSRDAVNDVSGSYAVFRSPTPSSLRKSSRRVGCGLHLLAAEGEAGSGGSQSPD